MGNRKPPKREPIPEEATAPAVQPRGRAQYVASADDRRKVEVLVAAGIPQERIAALVGVKLKTLKRHYAREIAVGQTSIDHLAVSTTVLAMESGGKDAFAAAKWWQQSRMGWSDRSQDDAQAGDEVKRIEVLLVGEPGKPRDTQESSTDGTPRPGAGSVDLVG
jgi:hypothetical protein